MSDDDGAQVFRLFPEADELREGVPVRVKPKPDDAPLYCRHMQTELDNDAHRVYCRDCKVEVEAFYVLKMLAEDFEAYAALRERAEKQAKAARDRLAAVERREKNAKSRLRRLRGKYEDEALAHLRRLLANVRWGALPEKGKRAYLDADTYVRKVDRAVLTDLDVESSSDARANAGSSPVSR